MDFGTLLETLNNTYFNVIGEFTKILSIVKRDGKYVVRMQVVSTGRKLFMEIDAETGKLIEGEN